MGAHPDRRAGASPRSQQATASLPFTLTFVDGQGRLTLRNYPLGALNINRLELNIRGLTFPFDLTGGAHQLRDRWLEVNTLELTVPSSCFREILGQIEPQSELFSDLHLEWRQQRAELTGRLGRGPESQWFVLQLVHDGSRAGDILLRPSLFVLLGPPALSYLQVVAAVSRLSWPHGGAEGLNLCFRQAARQVLLELLPPAGYRLPDCRALALHHLGTDGDGVTIVFGPSSASSTTAAPQALALREVQDLLQPGDEAVLGGDLEEARRIYWSASRTEPGHPLLVERIAWLDVINAHRREAALLACEKAVATHEAPGLRALIGSMALGRGDLDEAERQLTSVAEHLGPVGRSRVLTTLGQARAEKDPAGAAALLETALSHDPNYVDALETLRDCYVALGEREELRALGARLVLAQSEVGGRVQVLCEMGKLWLESFDDVAHASNCYKEALFHRPDDDRALLGLAECCRREGDWAAGLRAVETVVRHASARHDGALEVEAHVLAGRFWSAMGDELSAATRFHRAVTLDSQSLDALAYAVRADMALGRRDMAAGTLRQLMLVARGRQDLRSWRRALLQYVPLQVENLGAPKAAEAALRSYLAVCPDDEEINRVMAGLGGNPRGASRALEPHRDVGLMSTRPTIPLKPLLPEVEPSGTGWWNKATNGSEPSNKENSASHPALPAGPPSGTATPSSERAGSSSDAANLSSDVGSPSSDGANPVPPRSRPSGPVDVEGLVAAYIAAPDDDDLARQAVEALEELEDWPRLAGVLSGIAERTDDDDRKVEVYLHLVEVLTDGLDDGESAAACLLQVAQLVGPGPGAAHARRAAALLLQAGEAESAREAEQLASRLVGEPEAE